MELFKTEIKAWREKIGMTQKQAAVYFAVGMRTYQGWELAESEPTASPCMELIRKKMSEATPPAPVPAV